MSWVPRDEESRLRFAEVVAAEEYASGQHANVTIIVTFEDGSSGVFKPLDGEREALRTGIPAGGYWKREVAAYRIDRLLGFELVPTTVPREVDGRPGSVQDFVDDDGRGVDEYDDLDRQMFGVLDYLLANTDRHGANWMTHGTGRPAAIDNGLALPAAETDALKSPWTWSCLNKVLASDVLDRVRALDETTVTETLEELGIEPEAIRGLLARLAEVRTGTITGAAWHGPLSPG